MNINKKKITIILALAIFVLTSIFLLFYNRDFIVTIVKQNLSYENSSVVRYFYFNLPHKIPSIPPRKPYLNDLEIKSKLIDLNFFNNHKKNIKLFNKNYNLNLYMTKKNNLLSGIANIYSGSIYLDYYNEKLFILSSRGVLGAGDISDAEISIKQIESNINDFIGIKEFEKGSEFSVKDLKIINNKIYISFIDEVKNNCWSLSIIEGNINYKKINFSSFFSSDQCIDEINDEKTFNALESGGRIAQLNENEILFTVGDFRYRKDAQNENRIFGKILKINLKSNKYAIVTMGHRNQQGLYINKKDNIILSTEHGPAGGDEVNLIKIRKDKISNYGWPISSYGEHYGFREDYDQYNSEIYKKYPLHKSHKEYGFIEPLTYFTPSIGISEIVGIGNNKYIVSSLGAKLLYFFELKDKKKVNKLDKTIVGERIRDIIFTGNKIILSLEDTGSIGIINYPL